MNIRRPIFDAISAARGRGFDQPEVVKIDTFLDSISVPRDPATGAPAPLPPGKPGDPLTPRVALETASHEGLVQEAYKDSVGVWTWAIGITNASGHEVYPRYKDNPQPIRRCLEMYIWLLRNNYIPAVLKAFQGFPLTEAQFAAALSFHYNTGAIGKTDWVGLVKAGRTTDARRFLTSHYLNGGDLQMRRNLEARLFFDGEWSNDGTVNVYKVNKPSYTPNWSSLKKVDIRADIAELLAA